MDAKTLCSKCGKKPVVVIVAGEPLCRAHHLEWLLEECTGAAADRICRVMAALDEAMDQQIDAEDWEDHLRTLAIAAIEAAA